MTKREKKDINPLLLGVGLTLSFAGFLYTRIRSRPSHSDVNKQVNCSNEINDDVHTTPRTPSCREMASNSEANDRPQLRVTIDNGSSHSSPSTGHSSDRDRFLLPEFNELIREFDMAPIGDIMSTSLKRETETLNSCDGTPKGANHVERDDYEEEIQSLKTMVRDLRERERSLEIQLLEYYGLKEQETMVKELQNRLKIKNVEAKVLSLKIKSLQAENRTLEAKVADHSRMAAELEAAKAKIKDLKKKLRSDAEKNKEQILKLKQRVLMLQLQEPGPEPAGNSECSDPDMLGKLQRLEDLEDELEDLRKSKYELQRENSELTQRLESTGILASSVSEDPKVEELKNEVTHLRRENEYIAKEVERLQFDRCADAEELVYLRWVNACLRYELRNQHPQPGKTVARDLSKTLSPKSEAKAKQLILDYANGNEEKGVSVVDLDYDQWSSSQSHEEPDEPWVDALPAGKARNSKKLKFFDRLWRLVNGKEKDDQTNTHNKSSQNSTKSSRALSLSPEDVMYMESTKESLNSTRSSGELNRFTSVSAEDAKEMEIVKMNGSSSTSSSHRFVLGRERDGSISPLDSQPDKDQDVSFPKPDLVRYAEVLKDSPWTRKTHRKSASCSAV